MLELLAARVEGMTYRRMCADPTTWSNALVRATSVVGLDAVTIGFDPTLAAETCGSVTEWQGDQPVASMATSLPAAVDWEKCRVGVLLESVRRLCAVRSGGVVVVAMTGPATLARLVLGDAHATPESLSQLKPTFVRLADALCKERPDVLVIMETGCSADQIASSVLRRAYSTLKNIAAYYKTLPALYLEGYDCLEHSCGQWSQAGIDMLLVGKTATDFVPSPGAVLTAARAWRAVGVPAVASEAANVENLRLWREQVTNGAGDQLMFWTSPGLVSPDTDVAALRCLGGSLSGHA